MISCSRSIDGRRSSNETHGPGRGKGLGLIRRKVSSDDGDLVASFCEGNGSRTAED